MIAEGIHIICKPYYLLVLKTSRFCLLLNYNMLKYVFHVIYVTTFCRPTVLKILILKYQYPFCYFILFVYLISKTYCTTEILFKYVILTFFDTFWLRKPKFWCVLAENVNWHVNYVHKNYLKNSSIRTSVDISVILSSTFL